MTSTETELDLVAGGRVVLGRFVDNAEGGRLLRVENYRHGDDDDDDDEVFSPARPLRLQSTVTGGLPLVR